MSNRNILQALQSAGGAGGAGLDVDNVFSTHLYTGTDSSGQTITNNIDLSTEGGIVWVKRRNSVTDHIIIDPQKYPNGNYWVYVSRNSAAQNIGENVFSTSTSGFAYAGGLTNSGNPRYNASSAPYVSWTFRKAPKFFDAVSYTGNGSGNRQISHNLGTTVGMTMVKVVSHSGNWGVLHRSANAAKNMYLDTNSTEANDTYAWNSTHATSTHFTVGAGLNTSGYEYVAYLFAHNNDDGDFGPEGDQDIIKCGSYTGNGSSAGQEIDLGFEAQWILIKALNASQSWAIVDTMRGFFVHGINDEILFADETSGESDDNRVFPHASGFGVHTSDSLVNGNNINYVYVAIRKGSLFVPEDATKVFNIDNVPNSSAPRFTAGFPVDMSLTTATNSGDPREVANRLTATRYMRTNATNSESSSTNYKWDNMTGIYQANKTNGVSWMWKRAPGYFDVVTYTGTGAGTVQHGLTVPPEMMWVKARSQGGNWFVYHKDIGAGDYLELNTNSAKSTYNMWNDTAPTATHFSVGALSGQTNYDFVAYLFATAPGVSKVGSFSTSYSDLIVDCGFASSARFVLFKRTTTGSTNWDHWFIFDVASGISTGSDNFFRVNTTDNPQADGNNIEPHASGFKIKNGGGLNFAAGATIIFYAIA